MYHGLVEGVGIISFSMGGGNGVTSSGDAFVGVVRPEVMVAESTLSSSIEATYWFNDDCMVI